MSQSHLSRRRLAMGILAAAARAALSTMLVLRQQDPNLNAYLSASDMIDCNHSKIQSLAAALASKGDGTTTAVVIQRCFEYVRDEIQHSWDYQAPCETTCQASDVLKQKTGYCYAKSHLLAALLRANGIPTGLCYQRLSVSDSPSTTSDEGPFCLHGLNAVLLTPDDGQSSPFWYRLDPRGLKPGILQAAFCPPKEALAFPIQSKGEIDFPTIYVDPLPLIVDTLTSHKSWKEVADNLPDLTELPSL